jgi:3-oxoacyl-[acyl-carrier protein] reductase
MNLQGQVALVTGASRGIGRAIALELARHGAIVIGTATTEAGAAAISEALSGVTGAAAAVAGSTSSAVATATAATAAAAANQGGGRVLNVTDSAQCEQLIDAVQKEHGPVLILVNNAGITRDNLSMRMKPEEWSSVIATNLEAVFRMSQLVMRGMMKAKHGRIINIGSVVGSSGNAGQANYSAAKAGVAGMSRSLARELGSRNITVNCVAPGFIETDMTKALSEQQSSALLAQIPLGRLGQPEEIAATVAFLASPQAGYITGVTLHVNGGMYME